MGLAGSLDFFGFVWARFIESTVAGTDRNRTFGPA
jgi:hypothetical protein